MVNLPVVEEGWKLAPSCILATLMSTSTSSPIGGPIEYRFADDGRIPNNPRLPLRVYQRAVDPEGEGDLAEAFERLFAACGWVPAWRDGIYPFPHFHSTAHEVLGIAAGRLRVRLGGDRGVVVELGPGDAVVIPAGVGHQRLAPAAGLLVVGGYPSGQQPDLRRGLDAERSAVLRAIAALDDPTHDPVTGEAWTAGT